MKPIKKLSWIINNECNLSCVHCYPSSGIESKVPLSDNEFEALFNSLNSVRFNRIFLSGGEPLLDKQFFKYLDIAKKIGDEVFLCSNGTLLSNEMLERLSTAGVDGIVISLQSLSNEKSIEIYRHPKVDEIILNLLTRVKKFNFSLGIEMTILKQNYQIIENLINVASSYGVKSFSFKRLMKIGRGGINDVGLTPEENFKVLNKIFAIQLANKDLKINVHDPLYGTIVFDYYQKLPNTGNEEKLINGYACKAGTRWIGIDPSGNVSPCPLLLYQDTIIGNVFERSLANILEGSALIRQLQEVHTMKESKCKYQASCLGCRVASLAQTKDLFSHDPMCIHEDCTCPISSGRNG
ncbi:MAG: radical SAM protein [Clostridiaceae bacterium]|jgi:radical SAM protein with 4Fe4S-binding SPASM domain|nr:radical SAM protein [Clostridiaceae bacterium]